MICRICGNREDNVLYTVLEMMLGTREKFEYFQCGRCECLQIVEFPSDMTRYYPGDYYSYRNDFSKRHTPCYLKSFLKRRRDYYAMTGKGAIGGLIYLVTPNLELRLFTKIPFRKDAAILDVGSGVGSLLYSLGELGFSSLTGVDPFIPNDISYENGVTIYKKTLTEMTGVFDLIIFNHSFEHFSSPLEMLGEACRLLLPGGFCFISVPIVSSFAWKQYGVNWVQLDAPRHFFLPSVESMKLLIDLSGFHLTDIVWNSTEFQFWGSEQYLKDIPLFSSASYVMNKRHSIFSPAQIKEYRKRAKQKNLAGQGDQATFYLRKNP
jgi:SAM-dependent methyltransferase